MPVCGTEWLTWWPADHQIRLWEITSMKAADITFVDMIPDVAAVSGYGIVGIFRRINDFETRIFRKCVIHAA